MSFWMQEPKFFITLSGPQLKSGKDLYDYQIGHLASALIVDDYNPAVEIDTSIVSAKTDFLFPKDALLSGSFVMHHVAKHVGHVDLPYDDIDIYFKTKEDAQLFISMNSITNNRFNFDSPMCAYGTVGEHKINLIYGVEYDSPGHLISRFDIRACSMAIDPTSNTLFVVKGAIEDATRRQITFNPVPRGVSVRRLTKYIKKNFEIEKYQSLFFVELVRTDLYSAELELMTKEY
jgi:hypothetical protein